MDFDQRVAGGAALPALAAFAAQAQDLAVFGAGRDFDVEALAVGQGQAACGAVDAVEEGGGEGVAGVLAARGAGVAGAPALAEHRAEDVVEVIVAPAALLRAVLGVAAAGFAIGVVAVARFGGAFVAGGVDLAAVELAAGFRVGQDVVGGGDGFEMLFGLGVAGVEVWVMLFGELEIGAADLRLGGVACNAEGLVGIVHGAALRCGCGS